MKSTNQSLSRKDRIIAELLTCAATMDELSNDLDILDIDDAEKALKRLQSIIRDKKKPKAQAFETFC